MKYISEMEYESHSMSIYNVYGSVNVTPNVDLFDYIYEMQLRIGIWNASINWDMKRNQELGYETQLRIGI